MADREKLEFWAWEFEDRPWGVIRIIRTDKLLLGEMRKGGRWNRADNLAFEVTGIGGAADFSKLSEDDAVELLIQLEAGFQDLTKEQARKILNEPPIPIDE